MLEELYNDALLRNICNRTLNIEIIIFDKSNFFVFTEVINWIKA